VQSEQTKRPTSRAARRYHGLGGTPTYRSWYSMIDRCSNPANASWPHYGGKGVTVCERWLDLAAFVEDMGLRPEGMTIDRKDRIGNYEPANCQWATELEQQRNRGGVKCTEAMAQMVRDRLAAGASQSELAAATGMSQSNISRIKTGSAWGRRAESQ
jgi:hypothetical protein